MNARIIPFGMPFAHALRLGYAGPMRCEPYLKWIRQQPCWKTLKPGPSEASHPNFFKSQKNKGPDFLALPECRMVHEEYERIGKPNEQERLAAAAIYLLQAIHEGRLRWSSK